MTEEMNLAAFDPFKALAVKVQAEDAALDIDHTTPDGETKLRSWVRTVRGYRAGLEKIRVAAKANALEYGRAVDSLAKEVKGPFDTIITERMKPLDEIEDAKRKAAEAIVEAERVAKVKEDADRLADLERREKAATAKEAEIKTKEDAAIAEEAKAEQAGREKNIAAEAAEKATKLAEANAKTNADNLAKSAAAETARKQKEEDAAAEVERKRVADKTHRTKIHRAIEGFLRDYVLDAEASVITEELIAGNVPNVKIIY